jgi:aldehyde dehydrogenase (NAD+)
MNITTTEPLKNFVGGSWVAPAGDRYQTSYNPAHPEEEVSRFPRSEALDVDAAVQSASAAAVPWAQTPAHERGHLLLRFARLLDESKEELGRIITREMGKPLHESAGEVGRAAAEARFMAGESTQPDGRTYPSERPGITCRTVYEPIGVTACITPWNFPVVAPVRKIAPALTYGNTVVCKPASATPWSSSYLFHLLERAGIPEGVANLVIGRGGNVGGALVDHRHVRGITFTGSSEVGTRVCERAARRLARVQLELGGKNPALVLNYDDLDGAAAEIVSAALVCSGQRCTALSRVIVLDSEADALVERLIDRVGRIEVGDGQVEGTTMGPLVSMDQFKRVCDYVRIGRASNAVLLAGGNPLVDDPETEGYYHEPTLFDHVDRASPLAQEEIFGPVLPVIRVHSVEEAIETANETRYGLAASVFTNDPALMQLCADRIDAGMIHLNHGTASQSHVPFGGHKDSGYGPYSIGPTCRDFFTLPKAVYTKW